MTETTTAMTTVTIISIWSKWPGPEGKLAGRDKNVEYSVNVPAGTTPEETLENAFVLTNRDDRPQGNRACSTTAGDIMVIDSEHYFVNWNGFKKLTPEQSTAIQALDSRDTNMGWDWIVQHNNIPEP